MKHWNRFVSAILSICLVVTSLPVYLSAATEGLLSFVDAAGNTITVDESWEERFPYGTLAFSLAEMEVKEGESAKLSLYRLGGTAGRAMAYITYVPAIATLDEQTQSYAFAAGANDLVIRVENTSPQALSQEIGREPDPVPSTLLLQQDEAGKGMLRLSLPASAEHYRWQVLVNGFWQDIEGASEAEFLTEAASLKEYDFRLIYFLEGAAYATVSIKGEPYLPPVLEELPPLDTSLPLDYSPGFTTLPLDAADPYLGQVFEVVFADGEYVKEIHIDALLSDIPKPDRFGLFTIVDCEGASLFDTADKLILQISDDKQPESSQVGFELDAISVDRAAGVATLSVSHSAAASGATISEILTLDYATADGSAIAGVDYEATAGTLLFFGDMVSHNISVPLLPGDSDHDAPLSFSISLHNLRGNGTGLCTLTTPEITIYLEGNLAEAGDETGLRGGSALASGIVEDETGEPEEIVYEQPIDISGSLGEAEVAIAATEAPVVGGEAAEAGDIGVAITLEDAPARPGRSYTYGGKIIQMNRLANYGGWTDSYSLPSFSIANKGNATLLQYVNYMSTMYSGFYGSFSWSASAGEDFPYGFEYTYPWFDIIDHSGYRLSGSYYDCNFQTDHSYFLGIPTYYRWSSNPSGSKSVSWNMSSNLSALRLGTSIGNDRPKKSDAIGTLTSGYLTRRAFNNDFTLRVHTANDAGSSIDFGTVPEEAARLTEASGVYDSIRPTLSIVAGNGGINGQNKLYVGSVIQIDLPRQGSYSLGTADGPLDYSIYLTDTYGNIVQRASRVDSSDPYTYRMTMHWSGIRENDIQNGNYAINIAMSRRQEIILDLSPSVPRQLDAEGNVLLDIDTERRGEALQAFKSSGSGASIQFGYSKMETPTNIVVGGAVITTPFLPQYSEGEAAKAGIELMTASPDNPARARLLNGSSINWQDLQWIDFNLSPEDIILLNGDPYAGDERIYLNTNDLADKQLTFLYYSEEYKSVPSVMRANIMQTGVYQDLSGNGKIDGYYNLETGYFVLTPDVDNDIKDELITYLEPSKTYEETLFTPYPIYDANDKLIGWQELFFQTFYSMNPRSLELPAGASESDRAQVIPAFISSITDSDTFAALTKEQQTYSYIQGGLARTYEDNKKELSENDYGYSTDDHLMYGAAANRKQLVSIPLGGDRSLPKLIGEPGSGYYEWQPDYQGNLLFPFEEPEGIAVAKSVAGDNIPVGGSSDDPDYHDKINGYLGSYTSDRTYTLSVYQQKQTMAELLNPPSDRSRNAVLFTGLPMPESTAKALFSSFPDTGYLQQMQGQSPGEQDGGTGGESEYDEMDIEMGIDMPGLNISISDYVSFTFDGSEIAITIGIPLGGYKKETDSSGAWQQGERTTPKTSFAEKGEDMANIKKFLSERSLESFKGMDSGLKQGGGIKSGSFEVEFSLALAFMFKYNTIDNEFHFYQFSVALEAGLSFKYSYRFTPVPIVYVYIKVGIKVNIGTGLTVDREPREESLPAKGIKKTSSQDSGSEVTAAALKLKKGESFEFKTDYKSFTMMYSGNVLITSKGIAGAQEGTYKSTGSKPILFTMLKQDGTLLPSDDSENWITITAQEDTTITRLARVLEADSAVLWNGVNLTPEAFLEAGAGIGIELLKFEIFFKVNIGADFRFGVQSREYVTDGVKAWYETKTAPASVESFTLVAGVGFRAVFIFFTYEMDAVKYTLTYDGSDDSWKGEWSFFEDGMRRTGGQSSGVRLLPPASPYYRQQVYSAEQLYNTQQGGISATAINPSQPQEVPFQLSGYGSAGDAFKLADGLITGYDYRVVTVGEENYLVYTLSRNPEGLNPVDYTQLVLSKLELSHDEDGLPRYGLVNPVNANDQPAYIVVDLLRDGQSLDPVDDITGDLSFDLWVDGETIHIAWISYSEQAPAEVTMPDEPTEQRPSDPEEMTVSNYKDFPYPLEPQAPTKVDPVVEPDITNFGISEEEYEKLEPNDKVNYEEYNDSGRYLTEIEKTAYEAALKEYTDYQSYLAELQQYETEYQAWQKAVAAIDAWKTYFGILTDYTIFVQWQATSAALRTEVRYATFDTADTAAATAFTPAVRYTAHAGDHNYLPKGAGDTVFYVAAEHLDDQKLEDKTTAYNAYLSGVLYPEDKDNPNRERALDDLRKFRSLYQNGIWELYGDGFTLCAMVEGDDDPVTAPLVTGEILDSMSVTAVGDSYYVAYYTSELALAANNCATIRRLYLRRFTPGGTDGNGWGTPYLLRTIRDYDINPGDPDKPVNSQDLDGRYSAGTLVESYDDPYLANLKFLHGTLGTLLDGEAPDLIRGVRSQTTASFLLFDMNGTTYILPEAEMVKIVAGNGAEALIYPFFKPEELLDEKGNPVPQTTGRAEVTIGADGQGNIAAVYVAGVPNTMSNALWLSKYDAVTGDWGAGTILAMHNLQVYEDSFTANWANSEAEAAYFGMLDGYNYPNLREKESFRFSNLQVAMGQQSGEADVRAAVNGIEHLAIDEELPISREMAAGSARQNSGSDTLLILTQGTLTSLVDSHDPSGELQLLPSKDLPAVGIYALSFEVGGSRIGEDTLSFLNEDFSVGTALTASVSFTNTSDFTIRSEVVGDDPNPPITVELWVYGKETESETAFDELLGSWTITENILSGQSVQLSAELNPLQRTLPNGSIFYIKVYEAAYFGNGSGFMATTLGTDTDGNPMGTFRVTGKPDLGFETFTITPIGVDPSGNTILYLDMLVGNRGTEDAEGVYLQFSYETGKDSEEQLLFAPLDLTGHELRVGNQEALEIRAIRAVSSLPDGILALTGPDGTQDIAIGFGRKVEGTILVAPEAYEGSVAGSLNLKVDICSDVDTPVIGVGQRGVNEAISGENNSLNNSGSSHIERTTLFAAPSSLVLTPGNTLRLPLSLQTTTGSLRPVITVEEIVDDFAAPETDPEDPVPTTMRRNLGVLSFIPGDFAKGHMSGTLLITPAVVPQLGESFSGRIHIKDVNTNALHIITYVISDPGEGIDVDIENGYFSFFNSNGSAYDSQGLPGSQQWRFMGNVPTWGVDDAFSTLPNNPPLNQTLSAAKPGAIFSFTTMAESIEFFFMGTLEIRSERSSLATTRTSPTSENLMSTRIDFGENPDNQSFLVTVKVVGTEDAFIDKIIETYAGNVVPLPIRDDSAPNLIFDRSLPGTNSIKRDAADNEASLQLGVYIADENPISSVRIDESEQSIDSENTGFIYIPLTITQDMSHLKLSATDNAGNRAQESIYIDWFTDTVDDEAIAHAPQLSVDYTISEEGKQDRTVNESESWLVVSGQVLHLNAEVTPPAGVESDTTTVDRMLFDNSGLLLTDLELIPEADEPTRYTLSSNGIYQVLATASDGTWRRYLTALNRIDDAVPIVDIRLVETGTGPALEWGVLKKAPPLAATRDIQESGIVSVTINGYPVLETADVGKRLMGGFLPLTHGGSYAIRAEDSLGNYATVPLEVDSLPIVLPEGELAHTSNSWYQIGGNGSVTVTLNDSSGVLLTGGKYVTDLSDPATNEYVGTYQHLLVPADFSGSLTALLQLPVAAAGEAAALAVWHNVDDIVFTYENLAPGDYKLYLRDASSPQVVEVVTLVELHIADDAIGLATQSTSTLTNDGSVTVTAWGGKDALGAYQFAILPLGTAAALQPLPEMEGRGAEWQLIWVATESELPEEIAVFGDALLYEGLTAGNYQVAARGLQGSGPQEIEEFRAAYEMVLKQRIRFAEAENGNTENGIERAISLYLQEVQLALLAYQEAFEAWEPASVDPAVSPAELQILEEQKQRAWDAYLLLIGNDPNIIDLLNGWMVDASTPEEKEAAENAYSEAVRRHAETVVPALVEAEFNSSTADLAAAENAYAQLLDTLLQKNEVSYASDPYLWQNALAQIVAVEQHASLADTELEFDRGRPQDVVIDLDFGSFSLVKILVDQSELVAGKDYQVSGRTITLTAAALRGLNNGEYTLTFVMSGGGHPVAKLTVKTTGSYIPPYGGGSPPGGAAPTDTPEPTSPSEPVTEPPIEPPIEPPTEPISEPEPIVPPPTGTTIALGDNTLELPSGEAQQLPDGSLLLPEGGKLTTPGGTSLTVPAGTVISSDGNRVILPRGETGALAAYGDDTTEDIEPGLLIDILDGSIPRGDLRLSWVNPFRDLLESDWFYDDVSFAYRHALLAGISTDDFAPQMEITRGMIVTLMHRLAGSPGSDNSLLPFSDVSPEAYYYEATCWAASLGLAAGYSDETFHPEDPVSRQELAVFLCRIADYLNISLNETGEHLDFADADEIASYAAESLDRLVRAGILGGKPGNLADPLGFATRAELAALLHRLMLAVER